MYIGVLVLEPAHGIVDNFPKTAPGIFIPQHNIRGFEARLFGVALHGLLTDLPDQSHRANIWYHVHTLPLGH